MSKIIFFIIKIYQYTLSPLINILFPGGCAFTPTCSEYTLEAYKKHGIFKATLLSLKRFNRCKFKKELTYDPVPKN